MNKMINDNKLDLLEAEFQPWNNALENFNKCMQLENNKKCLPIEFENLLHETKAVNELLRNK
jgi:hypothetical protein